MTAPHARPVSIQFLDPNGLKGVLINLWVDLDTLLTLVFLIAIPILWGTIAFMALGGNLPW